MWLFPMTGIRMIIDCGMIIDGVIIVLVNGFIYSKAPSLATNNANRPTNNTNNAIILINE
jgi:hypothetical protein